MKYHTPISLSDIASIAKRCKKLKNVHKINTNEVEINPSSSKPFLSDHDEVLICRKYENMNILFGIEQTNKYYIKDPYSGSILGSIFEECSKSFLKRQFLGKHRPFSLNVYDADGCKKLVISRPFTILQSDIDIYNAESNSHIGKSLQHWHPWRRQYTLFNSSNKPLVSIDAGFLSWDFEVYRGDRKKPCLLTRNFTHLLREMFTDTGQYLIKFENMTTEERAILLGTAISIDFDYFSRSSGLGPSLHVSG